LTSYAASKRPRHRTAVGIAIAGIAGLTALLALTSCASGGSSNPSTATSLADLTNPALGPDYAQWLIGPVAFLATKEEVATYLSLHDDKAAESFIEQFWARRNPHPKRPDNALLAAYEERGAEADRLYSESGRIGRQTDRGTIYVIYGAPSQVDFEVPPANGAPPVEVWTYGTDASAGLNGRQPSPRYRFIKRGDVTVFYVPGRTDRLRRSVGPGFR